MRFILTLLVLSLFVLPSCSNKSGSNKESGKVIFKEGPMDSAYSKLRPAIQSFIVDNNKATIVKAANGTQLLVPANCFVKSNGDVVDGNVEIKIVEAFSLQDFITSGLATKSGDKLLISNGMMFINAMVGDEQLQLKEGASITVSMPTMGNNNGFEMFTGDGSNWKVDSSMTETDYTFPLPLDLLYPEGNKFFFTCIEHSDDYDDKWAYLDTTIISVTDTKYENTIIATEEFKKRSWVLRNMMEFMSFFTNRDYYFGDEDCMNKKHNYDIWKVYYEHPQRSFRESDSIARKMYIDYFTANEKKIAAFCNDVNKYKREYYSNWTDTNYYFDFRKTSLMDFYMEPLKYFPASATKEFKLINNHGVDLNATDAFDQLKAKGLDIAEINELLTYNFKKQSMLRILVSAKEVIKSKEKLSKMYEATVFSVSVMGWINCDLFYNDPAAGKAEMLITDNSNNKLDFIDFSLVIPDMNARLNSFPANPGFYSFTQADGPYTKLPIGSKAVIVGVSMRQDSLFFGSKPIIIKDGLNSSLTMRHINSESLKDSLQLAVKL